MKKLILFLGILCMGFQCDDMVEPLGNYGVWVVKNNTSGDLIISPGGAYDNKPRTLPAGGSVLLYEREYGIMKMPDFQSLTERSGWYGASDENIHFEVLTANGSLLAKWSYTERGEAGKQFFNETSWSKATSAGERDDEIKITWVFEIKQGDIQ